MENLGEYVELVTEAWLGAAVQEQIAAFLEGISEVFPFQKLAKVHTMYSAHAIHISRPSTSRFIHHDRLPSRFSINLAN